MLIYVHFRNFVLLWFDHDILLSPNVLVTRTELRGGYERGLPLLGVGVSVTSTYLSTFSSFLYAVYIARIFEDNNFHCFQNYSFKNKFLKLIVLYTVLCIQSSRSLKLNLQNWLWRHNLGFSPSNYLLSLLSELNPDSRIVIFDTLNYALNTKMLMSSLAHGIVPLTYVHYAWPCHEIHFL